MTAYPYLVVPLLAWAIAGGSVGSLVAHQLLLALGQSPYDHGQMLVEVDSEVLGPPLKILPAHRGGKTRLLELLTNGLGSHSLKPLGAYVSAGQHEPRELVNGIQRLLHGRLAGNTHEVGV